MNNSDSLREKLRAFLEYQKISPGRFSTEAGLSYQYAKNFLNGCIASPTVDVAIKIESTMKKWGKNGKNVSTRSQDVYPK